MSQDMMIFVTGVVGRAMGSGQFGAEHIPTLVQSALAAFQEHLAPKLAEAPSPPRSAPSASGGFQKPNWKGGAAAIAAGGDIPAETKPFSMWGGDKSYLFGRSDATWADILGEAQDGNTATRELLEKAARAGLGDDPKWHKNNARRIGRAKTCLAMLAGGGEPTPL